MNRNLKNGKQKLFGYLFKVYTVYDAPKLYMVHFKFGLIFEVITSDFCVSGIFYLLLFIKL